MTLPLNSILEKRYRIENKPGQGGFGAVYQATDTRLNVTCANIRITPHGKAARSEFIKPAHILIGILSLEKFSAQDGELAPSDRQSLQVEQDDTAELLRGFELDETDLQHGLREALGRGR